MFLVNSRLGSFAAAPHLPMESRPYPEVSAAVLPSSLRMFLSYTLVFSTQPPVSVYGTGTIGLSLEAFLGSFSHPLAPSNDRARDAPRSCAERICLLHENDAPTS